MKNEKYKYECWSDLGEEVSSSLFNFMDPIFKSYRIDKVAFIFQIINFVLCFLCVKFFLSPFLSLATTGIQGNFLLGVEIILALLLAIFLSACSKQKWLKWETIFEMSRKVAFQFRPWRN